MNQPRKILINGKEYNTLDQVPEELKQILKDENQNGIPDIAEGKFSFGDVKNIFQYAMKNPGAIQVQSQTYSNFGELPPEAKAKVEQAMANFSVPASQNVPLATGSPVVKQGGGVWVFLMILIGFILTLAIAGWFIFSYLTSK